MPTSCPGHQLVNRKSYAGKYLIMLMLYVHGIENLFILYVTSLRVSASVPVHDGPE